VVIQALTAARETLYQRTRPSTPRASPFKRRWSSSRPTRALVAETALHHGIDPGAPGERYQVVVHVEAPVLADADAPGQSVIEDGVYVPAGTSQRFACDASRVVMRHDADGGVTEVGARTRRPTTLSNLALLCRRHHRAVHEEGYQVERQADGELRFDGRRGGHCPTPRLRPLCRPIPSTRYEPATTDMGFRLTRGRPCPAGSESGWTLAARSTSCTHWPPPTAASSTHTCPPRADRPTAARAAEA
jgi:hypothetical protein